MTSNEGVENFIRSIYYDVCIAHF